MSSERSCACCQSAHPSKGDADGLVCYCPLDGVVDAISKRYSLQIIALLGVNGPTRFKELARRLDVTSSSTFSERLTDLAEEGLIERCSFDEAPPRVEYSLTRRGRALEEQLQPLLDWAATT